MSPSAEPPIFAALSAARDELKALEQEISDAEQSGEDVTDRRLRLKELQQRVDDIRAKLPTWKADSPRPPIDQCIPRRLYEIRSRSLGPRAVYLGHGEFIGLQHAMVSVCMFTEYHWDTGPPYGTVYEAVDTGIDLPDEIPLSSSPGTVDERSGRWVAYNHDERSWYFIDTGEFSSEIKPKGYHNGALYDWLWENGANQKHWSKRT